MAHLAIRHHSVALPSPQLGYPLRADVAILMASEMLSIAETVKRLGVARRQVENLINQGMPCEGTGNVRRIPWPEARAWRDQQFINLGKSYGKGKGAGLEDSRARRAEADAELIEIELQERRGELMTLADGERAIGDAFARVRSKLLNMPNAIGMRVTGETLPLRIQQAQSLVDEVMADLAHGDDVPEPTVL
jgi:hypothetical protein